MKLFKGKFKYSSLDEEPHILDEKIVGYQSLPYSKETNFVSPIFCTKKYQPVKSTLYIITDNLMKEDIWHSKITEHNHQCSQAVMSRRMDYLASRGMWINIHQQLKVYVGELWEASSFVFKASSLLLKYY